jgi:small GTP-binding protein
MKTDVSMVKLILLGEYRSGKTSLMDRITKDKFYSQRELLTRCCFMVKDYVLNKQTYRLQFWDPSGMEKFAISKLFYREAGIVFFTFSIACRKTFDKILYWISEYYNYNISAHAGKAALFLVGCQSDLASSREVSYEEAYTLGSHHGLIYVETSAKNADNTDIVPMVALAKYAYLSTPI